ncbi:ApbE family protein [Psychromonas sp. CNPT3]|uniref:FAD:protein FMN transferase n=1 Tax=Psychromonas sp. CNPT3 TaxID=314282 RepID=UPI00006E708E|nr:FAD:protein FMN transferase [Psychromonas sp. CNPT3]AGH80102.1 ApbE family protein [Psychromonas sp. CNPT3]
MSFNTQYKYHFNAMSVPCEIILYAPKAQKIAHDIQVNTLRLEKKYNFHQPSSWLNKMLNQRNGSSLKVDSECAKILTRVRHLSQLTDQVFDICIGTLKDFNLKNKHLTRSELYLLAAPFMGLSCWEINQLTLTFKFPQTKFDLGGVIKEYAIDEAIKIAKQAGASGALINFGGDIATLGCKDNGKDFIVAVIDPSNPQKTRFALPLKNQALTTSAHYQRHYQFNDEQTSHILSSKGTHKQVISASVVANSALEAGIYSTALTIKPDITLPDNAAFVLIDPSLNLHQNTEFISL